MLTQVMLTQGLCVTLMQVMLTQGLGVMMLC